MTFVHVIPSAWGPFVDIRACWQSMARRRPWTHVISPAEFAARKQSELWHDPSVLFIAWLHLDPGSRDDRSCKVATVYSEAMDDDGSKLLPAHLNEWHSFKSIAGNLDCTFTHTPWMAKMIARAGVNTHILPTGWDAEAMGSPRSVVPKHVDVAFYGSMVGRREVIFPFLHKNLTDRVLADFTGSFGRGLLGRLDTAAASLYVAHSDVQSFSTWRLWQVASTSAALIAEPGDTWPFEPIKHYLQIPKFTVENMHQVARLVQELADQRDLLSSVSAEAHALARTFTMEHIEDHFIAPVAATL